MSNQDGGGDIEEEARQAEIVSRFLGPNHTAHLEGAIPDEQPSQSSDDVSRHANGEEAPEPESSLKLQGGDIHRDLYKISARAAPNGIQRSQTFSHPVERPSLTGETATEQRQPGAFRRHYVRQHQRSQSYAAPITSNFVYFLDLYGSFAGEDLAESEDEDAIDDEEGREEEERLLARQDDAGERRPLLRRRGTSRAASKPGDANITRTFFLLLKSFIGTGVLFLPKAFKNGGILFSSMTMLVVSVVSCLAFHLLLQCRARFGGGYGDIAEAVGGKRMRTIVLASIGLSQLGFVCAGIIFAAQNMYSFLDAVTAGPVLLSITALIGIQLLILIPLSFIRDISKLGGTALLADVFILLGLGYIYYFDISTLHRDGLNPSVQLFNPHDFTLTIGSAIFTFEGIGLILPIQSSMKQPQKFEPLLFAVLLLITVIFTSVGALSYATFGASTTVEIISNLPQDSPLVNAVQCLYSLAVLAGDPVQLFPATRIIEGAVFGRQSGKRDALTKWKKNALRAALVCLCGVISALGAADLDKFVALIGSFACVPLVYIYPPYLHWKGVAESRRAKVVDVVLMSVGLVAMVYTTAVTVARWSEA